MNDSLTTAVSLLLAAHEAHQAEREASEQNQTYTLRLADPKDATPEMQARLTEAGFGKAFAPPKPKKKPEGEKAPVAKQDTSSLKTSHGEAYDPKGTLDARGYFEAIKLAGKRRNEHGVMVIVGKTLNGVDVVAADKRAAIAAYIGYNPFELLGSQELRATAQANRELGITKLNGPMPKEVYAKLRTVEGVTFGLPDHTGKRLADLEAQQRALIDVIGSLEAKVNEILALRNRAKREEKFAIMAQAQTLLSAKEGEVIAQRALLDACEASIADCR
jgi:hypothetical protein